MFGHAQRGHRTHSKPNKANMSNFFDHATAFLVPMMAVIASSASLAQAQVLSDPGFESYAVTSGGFVQPVSGPWVFANDAGVVEPFAPNSSTALLHTWSAMLAPVEGQQYASTYASLDSLSQVVSFAAAGDYRISVYAAAPSGSLTIPSVGTFTLESGEFTFLFSNTPIGSLHPVPDGSSWSVFSANFNVPTPGAYEVGVRNTRAAPYFINYDAFAVESVPEPTVLQLSLALGVGGVLVRVFQRQRKWGACQKK